MGKSPWLKARKPGENAPLKLVQASPPLFKGITINSTDNHSSLTMGCKRMAKRKKRDERYLSFSARLPGDVRGAFAQSICAVKCSSDPFADFRKSIAEMIHEVGVQNWEEMEELVYCYVVLNSSDVHGVIKDAFLSVCSHRG